MPAVVDKLLDSAYSIGGQNIFHKENGAFTGEVSVSMIKVCGAKYVIIGHSERRHIFGESNEWVNKKLKATLDKGLSPILCIGETIEQRKTDQTEQILREQLEKGFDSIDSFQDCIIAYEPVWAIGTGMTADNQQVRSAHNVIRDILGNNNDIQIKLH